MNAWLHRLTWDWWVAVGAIGQVIFFSRFMHHSSERRGVSLLPRSFWWSSIVGSLVLLVYGVARHDPVFVVAYLFNCIPYARNLMLVEPEERRAAGPVGRPAAPPLAPAPAPGATSSARRRLSVVVPAFCEEGNLRPLHAEVVRALDGLGLDWELVLVDDASTDGTAAVGRALAEEDPRVRLLELSRRCGQTCAMTVGLREARGELLATLDADLQNDPADLPRLLARLEGTLEGAGAAVDAVCGWRRRRGGGLVRRLSTRVANAVRDWGTGDRVHDSGCCFRVFRRECVAELQLFDGMHRFLPTLIRTQGFVVEELEINHRPRASGTKKYGGWSRVFEATRDLLAVRWMLRSWIRPAVSRRSGVGLARRLETTPAA